MTEHLLPISPALSKYVANAVYFNHNSNSAFQFQMVPRIFTTLFFVIRKKQDLKINLGGDILDFNNNSVYAFGVGNLPAGFDVVNELEVILVMLHPGISRILFHDDANIFTNGRFDLTDMDQTNKNLNEKIAYATSLASKWQIIQEYLVKKLVVEIPDKYGRITGAIEILQKSHGNISINSLSENVFTCRRNLHDLFLQFVGFSPKQYADIIRFNRFVKLYTQHFGSLSQIGYQCGYHDLSHLNKDFTRFVGTSPSAYFGTALSADINNWCEIDYLAR